jgi:hypothetical protein
MNSSCYYRLCKCKHHFRGALILCDLPRLSDHRLLEDARRLRQDTAVQRGSSHERNVRLDQEDAL